MPKIDNEGAQRIAAFDDTRGDVVRGMIDVDGEGVQQQVVGAGGGVMFNFIVVCSRGYCGR